MIDGLKKKQGSQLNLFENFMYLDQKTEFSELLITWEKETNPKFKKKLKETIINLIEIKERQTFLARYRLRAFDSLNKVLTDEESAVSRAHKAEFYEPNLILTLYENHGCLPALEAISKTIARVKHKLSLADYKLTASNRFRFDTTIRFLAHTLKKQGMLSNSEKYKNKYWALTEKGMSYAKDMLKKKSY